jgi:hypothetical protein
MDGEVQVRREGSADGGLDALLCGQLRSDAHSGICSRCPSIAWASAVGVKALIGRSETGV